MRPRFLALVFLLPLATPPVQAAPRPWVEVKTPHFTVYSDDSESAARDVGWAFEQARTAYATIWGGATPKGGKPYVIFAARNAATLKSLGPAYWERKAEVDTASFQVEGADRRYVAIRTDVDTGDDVRVSPYFTPYRAYVGTVLNSIVGRQLPPWLYRGLTEVYGNTRVRKQDVLVGRLVPWHLRTIQEKSLLPLQAIFAVPQGSREAVDDQFNATAWALLHYLSFGEKGALGARLNQLLGLWQQGRSQEVAIAEALGDLSALEKGLGSYLSHSGLPYRVVAVDATVRPERFTARALSLGEAAAAQAALHVAMRRSNEAKARIAEAKAADPGLVAALDAEALLADGNDADEAALAAYRKAAEAGSASYYTHYRLAQLSHRGGSGGQEAYQRIAASLDRAILLNPDYAFAHSYLAEVKSFLGDPQAALGIAKTAIALEPNEAYHHIALGRVLADLSQGQEALASAHRGLALASDDGERHLAQQVIDRVRQAASAPPSSAGPATAPEPTAADTAEPTTRTFVCGVGQAKDCSRVAAMLATLCEEGHGENCAGLASLYAAGLGVAKDPPKAKELNVRARKLLEPACQAGDTKACAALQRLPK